jgi:glycosyltransferase involved in cell wall biosynthesis
MKSIKVYLQKPWRFSEDSQYYTLLKKSPPEGIEYIFPKKSELIQKSRNLFFLDSTKIVIRNMIKKLYPSMPNANYDKEGQKYDLIHCMRCMSKNKKPWICDLEFAGSLWITIEPKKNKSREQIIQYLKSPYCKKIIPWTEWCAKEIITFFPQIKDKVEVVYPAINKKNFKKVNTGKTILLYVSRRFYFKGGLYALEVMDRITKENKKVEGWIVSDVPKEVYEKYKENKQLKFLGTQPQKELFKKIYPRADIFLYPSFTDTFGYVMLEAMSFGLPVVSIEGQSRREVITDNHTGKIVYLNTEFSDLKLLRELNEKIVVELKKATDTLIKNKKIRGKMSKNCIAETSIGKFSIKERNKKIKKIVMEAIK